MARGPSLICYYGIKCDIITLINRVITAVQGRDGLVVKVQSKRSDSRRFKAPL